jgi:hypothetical protein
MSETIGVPQDRVEALLRQLVQGGRIKAAAMAMGHVLHTLETAAGDITVAVPAGAMLALLGGEQEGS